MWERIVVNVDILCKLALTSHRVCDGICADHDDRTSPTWGTVGMRTLSWLLGVQASLMAAPAATGGQCQELRAKPRCTTSILMAESGPVNVGAVLSSMLIVWLRLALTFPQRSVTVYVRTTTIGQVSCRGTVGYAER